MGIKNKAGAEDGAAVRCSALLAIATAALERISKCEDAPDIDATGEWQTGLHCGVEDRDCQDRYQGADYGHTVGVEKGLEWASNEAKHALEQMANDLSSPTRSGGNGGAQEGQSINKDTSNAEQQESVRCSALLGGWRDMESAPKTGSILVYRDGRIVMARWDDQKYHSNPKPYWASEKSWTSVRRDREHPPQAWMPLPNPPNVPVSNGVGQ